MANIGASISPGITKTPDLVYVKRWQAKNMRWCPSCKVLRPTSTIYWKDQYDEITRWCDIREWRLSRDQPNRAVLWSGRVGERVKSWCYEETSYADETLQQFLCPACLAQLIWEAERTFEVAKWTSETMRYLTQRTTFEPSYTKMGIMVATAVRRYPRRNHEWTNHMCNRPLWIGPELKYSSINPYLPWGQGWSPLNDPKLLQELVGEDVDLRFRHRYCALREGLPLSVLTSSRPEESHYEQAWKKISRSIQS
ncbi:hypothetical protein H2200_005000 [Cladophialophora chaetospira]|uniref:Uncharacterized protein n=1 Tax=Cladophialophora chaetospira TaxID=386627 RepID=A0AA38XB48_9EURO|nr:hypothetical protein H2200_005000 [Cladophialophora chaetospira]